MITQTPETDALYEEMHEKGVAPPLKIFGVIDLCRRLERERDEARKLLEAESRDAVKIAENLFGVERELDEARLNFEAEKERGDTNAAAFWKAEELLIVERALADRLAMFADVTAHSCPNEQIQRNAQEAINEWKEARK